ncbi:MAG: nucleotidyltransferase domain-containing protein [Burkholderiales bacterium]
MRIHSGLPLIFPKFGMIIPNMGNDKPVSISDVLFSGVQQRVLGLLFGQPDRSFYANEIERLGMTGRGALERELKRMTASGLVNMTVIGRQKHYQANRNSPIFQEIRGITLKTFGMSDVLRVALSQYADAIRCAFIYGSVAKGTDTATSDIDVMVVAEGLSYSELFEALTKAEETLGRKVSPTLYSTEDFRKKTEGDNHFLTRVLSQPRIVFLGNEDVIRSGTTPEPAEDRQAQG